MFINIFEILIVEKQNEELEKKNQQLKKKIEEVEIMKKAISNSLEFDIHDKKFDPCLLNFTFSNVID